jgi:hypothetical protein
LLFDGAATLSPPDASENDGRMMRWPILKPWVTDPSGIIVTLVMFVAFGVPTKNMFP